MDISVTRGTCHRGAISWRQVDTYEPLSHDNERAGLQALSASQNVPCTIFRWPGLFLLSIATFSEATPAACDGLTGQNCDG